MSHFWLNPDQQAIMDTATSTAESYPYIGLFGCGKAWKRAVQAMVGSAVEPQNYQRVWNIAGKNEFLVDNDWVRLDAAIRMTKNQAMTFKLRHTGMASGVVHDDPTGETWGNMLMASDERQNWRGYGFGFSWNRAPAMTQFVRGNGFGPTLASVGRNCKGLPTPWARALVWNRASAWHLGNEPYEASALQSHELAKVEHRLELARDAFDMPIDTNGQVVARQWWSMCQDSIFRRQNNCNPYAGESTEVL